MRVPAPVKKVLDTFPLATLPEYTDLSKVSKELDDTPSLHRLFVYAVDSHGLPLDPKSLLFVAFLAISGTRFETKIASPYMSSAQTLPLLHISSGAVVQTLDELLEVLYAEVLKDKELRLYRALVDAWIHDAWIATIIDAESCEKVYNIGSAPWPFKTIVERQRDAHVASKFQQQYHTSDLHMAGLALRTLENMVNDEKPLFAKGDLGAGALGAFDLIVFSYVWPILHSTPDTALASLIGPRLQKHAKIVHEHVAAALN